MPVKRNHNSKDVDMLIAASIIVENAIVHKAALQTERTAWADPYFEDLKASIDHTVQTYLGVDSAMAMRQATAAIKSIQKVAMNDLAKIKLQITGVLKRNKEVRTELLRQLGFTTHLRKARSGSQEELINLLYQFKLNLTPAVRTQLTGEAGVSDKLLNAIVGYADHLKEANVGQEVHKGARKNITQEAVKAFNDIYDPIILISKIAAKHFKDDQALKELFSYAKILKRIRGNSKPPSPDEFPPAE